MLAIDLLAISLAGCIQWEEDVNKQSRKAIDEYDKFKACEVLWFSSSSRLI